MDYLLNLSLHAYILREIETMQLSDQYNEIEQGHLVRWHELLGGHDTLEQDYCTLRVLPYNPLLSKIFYMVNSALRETRPFEIEAGIPVRLFFQSQ